MIPPVVHRELRAEARRPFTYWLRIIGAGGVILSCWVLLGTLDLNPAHRGPVLFGSLNTIIFATIWLMGPLITADCLSREQREGTLGLLFLTPLRPVDIVAGKFIVHFLRAFTLFLAMLPPLAIPILMGGITGRELAIALTLNSAAFFSPRWRPACWRPPFAANGCGRWCSRK